MNRDAIIRKAKGAFGKVQGLMPGYRMFLLKRGVERSGFVVVAELTIPFWSRWSTYREQTVFEWADDSAAWMDLVAQTSHIGYGLPTEDSKVDVYPISADQRDRVAPSGGNLIWKLYGVRDAKERFTIPEA